MSKKKDFYDDGRTIANMNIEGMPFYDDRKESQFNGQEKGEKQKPEFSTKEAGQVAFSAMLAGLAIGGVFLVGGAIFIAALYFLG